MQTEQDHVDYTTTDDVRLRHRVWRGGDRGTIVFIHGLGADGRQYAQDAEFFAGHRYQVFAVNLRGHGSSQSPSPLPQDALTVERMASDLLPLLEGCECGPVHLVGNSLGGLVALSMVEQCSRPVASITTFGTTYRLWMPPGLPGLQYLLGKVLGIKRLARIVANNATNHSHARPLIEKMYAGLNLRLIHLIQKNIRAYDYLNTAAGFDGPIMVIRGEHDSGINRQLGSTIEALEKSGRFQLCKIDDAGHFTNLDRPEAFRQVLHDFLSQQS